MTAELCDAGKMHLQMDKDVSLLLQQEVWKSEPKEEVIDPRSTRIRKFEGKLDLWLIFPVTVTVLLSKKMATSCSVALAQHSLCLRG